MKPTILFVDDDPNVRVSFKRILKPKPYRVLTLESVKQCVEVLAVTDVQVLVTDLSMPGIGGEKLIRYFKDNKPDVVRIILSGKLTASMMFDLVSQGEVFRCLEKPCQVPTLLSVIDEALKYWKEKNQSSTNSRIIVENNMPQRLQGQNIPASLIHDALSDIERLELSLKKIL